jgi:putative IMPACT (imprinted ancient) family translation regulator
VVIVTRYYGGTKLGTGGLARAYGGAGALALDACTARRVRRGEIHHVRYDYADTGAVARLLDAPEVQRGPDEFGADVRTEIRLPTGAEAAFARLLRDATSGRATLESDASPERCWIPVT